MTFLAEFMHNRGWKILFLSAHEGFATCKKYLFGKKEKHLQTTNFGGSSSSR